jgi:hypothetical protein
MSQVIVNEFELVPAPPPSATIGETSVVEAQQAENPPAHSAVLEIENVVRRHSERQRRIWAH